MNLQEFAAKKAALDAEMKEHGKAAVLGELKAFFDKHPNTSIQWRQYAPYFNDGEECVFGVHGVGVVPPMKGDDDDNENDFDSWSIKYHIKKGDAAPWMTPSIADDLEVLERLLYSSEDLLKAAFGDHVRIIANIDGIEVESYEHD